MFIDVLVAIMRVHHDWKYHEADRTFVQDIIVAATIFRSPIAFGRCTSHRLATKRQRDGQDEIVEIYRSLNQLTVCLLR